jgi:hypothetical protein
LYNLQDALCDVYVLRGCRAKESAIMIAYIAGQFEQFRGENKDLEAQLAGLQEIIDDNHKDNNTLRDISRRW